jgi:hypothetical protein
MKLTAIVLSVLTAASCQKDPAVEMFTEKAVVIDVVTRLFIETDNRNWPEVQRVFSGSVDFDMTSLAGGEPSRLAAGQITDAWNEGLKKLQAIHHQAGNFRVTISGEKADVFCYGIAMHYLPNPTQRNVRMFVDSYDFKLAKTSGNWRITHFKFNSKFIDGNSDLEGSAAKP